MQHDALYPAYAVPASQVGDVRKTPEGKQMFTGTGWITCDGRTLLTVDYPVLFRVLAYTFGGNGGSFKLPDLGDSREQVHPESALISRGARSDVMPDVIAAVGRKLHQEMLALPHFPPAATWSDAALDASQTARECLSDVVTHHADFRQACENERKALADDGDREAAEYWVHQIAVLDRMKAQAEAALSVLGAIRSAGDTGGT